ncbi:MAG: gamma carbonic anhydrase family protein [Gammaproteobacteria bacterium]|nr:MAG: gamma carbonic anhydrase family protein [Pseudomonadota bacterium]PIE38308.1 MAG: gamma carbonic anhydrase family protein [Gammaproteobacteria bacterium]
MTIRSYLNMTPKLGKRVFVDETALVIGDVEIGDDCSVWPMTTIRGDMHRIRIGDRCSIQDGSVFHITHASDYNPDGFSLTLGNDVTVGHKALLHGCTVHNEVLVGMGSIVMDGAVIESQVILGAGSLVTPGKVLESGYIYAGSPARRVRELTEKERTYFTYTANNYVKLKNSYMESGQP